MNFVKCLKIQNLKLLLTDNNISEQAVNFIQNLNQIEELKTLELDLRNNKIQPEFQKEILQTLDNI